MGKNYRKSPHYTIHGKEKIRHSEDEAKRVAKITHKNHYLCYECNFYHVGGDNKQGLIKRKEKFIDSVEFELGMRVSKNLSAENYGSEKQKLNFVIDKARSAKSRAMMKL